MNKKIGVISGGYSSESSISLESADTVISMLKESPFELFKVIITKGDWYCIHKDVRYEVNKENLTVNFPDNNLKFDSIFNAIHGEPGEGGEIQEYLCSIKMPFTSSGQKASAISFSKAAAKELLQKDNIVMPSVETYSKSTIGDVTQIANGTKFPCIVKPNSSGSSYGVSKANNKTEFINAVELAFKYNHLILVEQFISGVELSCGVVEINGRVRALPVTEIEFDGEIFDFKAKYADDGAREITPARISKEATSQCQDVAEQVFEKLNLKDMARIDFILMDDEVYFIECNTIPGLSKNSILPKQLKEAGINMGEFFIEMIENSACRL